MHEEKYQRLVLLVARAIARERFLRDLHPQHAARLQAFALNDSPDSDCVADAKAAIKAWTYWTRETTASDTEAQPA